MSEKNAAFHRLASQRVEKFEEAFKIFSNLCGPSYQRTPDEVMAYFARIDAARTKALTRFQECKWWRDAQPAQPAEIEPPAPSEPEPVQPDPEPEETAPAPPQRTSRAATIAELLRNAETNEVEALAEMVAMQREVIERLQEKLDGKAN